MSRAVKILPYYTYSDYVKWEGRWEIIDGMPYAMSPAPSPFHQYVANEIKYEFTKAIKNTNCKQCKVYDFIDIKINEDTVIQPDGLIVCKPTPGSFLDFPPSLVMEVLSPSTALKDLNNKYIIYQSFGVKYYVIADPEKLKIDVYQLNDKGIYVLRELTSLHQIPFDLDECNLQVNLDQVFV